MRRIGLFTLARLREDRLPGEPLRRRLVMRGKARRLMVLAVCAAAAVLADTRAGRAAGPFTPTTTADGGSGSLRDAIIQANAAGGASEINLEAGQTYELTIPDLAPGTTDSEDAAQTGDLDVGDPLTFTNITITIHGNGATIKGTPAVGRRILEVVPGATLVLDDLTITGGFACGEPPITTADVGFDGGGIQNRGGLSLSHVTVRGNAACGGGGGIANSSFVSVSIDSSTVSGNSAFKGGGIANVKGGSAILTITGSAISGNKVLAGGAGGGIYNRLLIGGAVDELAVDSSTLAENVGGALLNNGVAKLTNVTVARNVSLSSSLGGGISNDFSSISGVFIRLRNSIIAGNENTANPQYADCHPGFGMVQSLGNNLRSSTGCDPAAGWQASDILAADPGLGGLGRFGLTEGATETVRLKPTSPAIDAGNVDFFRGTDQRGVAQFGAQPDIGAFEYVPGATASFTASDTTPLDGAAVDFTNTSSSTNAGALASFWDLGDGMSSTDESPTHSFSAPDHPNTYTVTLNIVDEAGSADEASLDIVAHPANERPTAAFTGPTTAAVGQTVSFDASASRDADGTILSYDWNWGDGETGTGALASHAWARPGTFTVTQTVTDDGGRTDSASSSITVSPLNFYVDDDWAGTAPGADPDGAGPATSFGTDAFATITDALNAANAGLAGSSIFVAAGTYAEGFLSLSKDGDNLVGAGLGLTHVTLGSLDVSGAGTLVEHFDLTGSGSGRVVRLRGGMNQQAAVQHNRIGGGAVGVSVEGSSNNVIFENVLHDNGCSSSFCGPSAAVLLQGDGNLVLANTIASSTNHGISVRGSFNAITNNQISGSGAAYPAFNEPSGIEVVGSGDIGGNVISGNTIRNSAFAGIKVGNRVDGTTISGNLVDGTRNGGANGGASGANAGGAAILITTNGASNTTITGNQLGPNTGYGILQAASGGASTGTVAHQNAITGNALGGVVNRDSPVLDARNNWWGAASGPSGDGPGSGDPVFGNVLFDPFAASAACFGLNSCPLRLVVTQQPGNAFAGTAFGTQPVVQVRDALGNLQTGSTAPVTASIPPGTGKAGAILSGTTGTTTFNAVGGVAAFTGLRIDRAGTGFRLRFEAPGADSVTSDAFDVGGSTVTGHVYANTPSSPLNGAKVQVCKASVCSAATTNAAGEYTAMNVSPGSDVVATAFPPPGLSSLAPGTLGPITVPGGGGTTTGQDITLTAPVAPPAGTGITPSSLENGIPRVFWTDPLTLTTSGNCTGGTASYAVTIGTAVVRNGSMPEGPSSGTYTATITPFEPLSGFAHVTITITCPSGSTVVIAFDIYIDPSGVVQRPDGTPVAGATVTLHQFDEALGAFAQVPDGDAVMSPSNRTNPDLSNGAGRFGWDTIAGTYRIRAEKSGCFAPGSASSFVETDAIEVPPPRLDLVLVLDCPNNETITTIGSSDNPSAPGQDVTFTATVTSGGFALPLGSVNFSEGGVPLGPPVALDAAGHAELTTSALTAGTHLIQADYLPAAGYDPSADSLIQAVGSAPADTTAPEIQCAAPDGQWHATDVSLACTASDAGSGLANPADASFSLSTNVAADTETGDAPTDSREVCDVAGNCATAGPFGGNKVDKKAPAIAIRAPSGTYLLGQPVAADYSCTDAGSGVASCDGPAAIGSNVDTASAGTKDFSVSARDRVGNAASRSVQYAVTHGIAVLYDTTRAKRSGSTFPVKVQITDAEGNNRSSSQIVVTAVRIARVSDDSSAPLDDSGNANPDSNFRFDATLGGSGGYIFNLGTSGFAGGTYRLFFTVGGDPVEHGVPFQVK